MVKVKKKKNERKKYPRKNRNISGELVYYIAWTTRKKKPVLWKGINNRLEAVLVDICREMEWTMICSSIKPTYVFLVVRTTTEYSPQQVVFKLKRESAITLRQEYSELAKMPSLWNLETHITTVPSSEEDIWQYVY
ncbi:MAG: IS200/IS605 family transposase [Syntrophorhabdus sp.]|jgi:putative transposase|nr:IS200/IS605 family transposase [Pseudomonadota bacterium]